MQRDTRGRRAESPVRICGVACRSCVPWLSTLRNPRRGQPQLRQHERAENPAVPAGAEQPPVLSDLRGRCLPDRCGHTVILRRRAAMDPRTGEFRVSSSGIYWRYSTVPYRAKNGPSDISVGCGLGPVWAPAAGWAVCFTSSAIVARWRCPGGRCPCGAPERSEAERHGRRRAGGAGSATSGEGTPQEVF